MTGRHGEDCDDPTTCRGCLPAPAADGVLLCPRCILGIAEHADRAARLYPMLTHQLIRQGHAAGGTGSVTGGPVPDERVMALRAEIHAVLVDTARLIVGRRGVSGPLRWTLRRLPTGVEGPEERRAVPTGNRRALARLIARHAEWLAGQPEAGEVADRLWRVGRRKGEAWYAAFPSGKSRLYVGDCPLPAVTLDGSRSVCGSRLYQRPDEPLITCHGCGVSDTIEWWQKRIVGDQVDPVADAYAAAAALSRLWYRPVDASVIRKWAERARRVGRELAVVEPDGVDGWRTVRDERHRTLYRLALVRAEAERLWGPAPVVVRRRRRRAA